MLNFAPLLTAERVFADRCGKPVVRIVTDASGATMLTHIGAAYTAPVPPADADAKARRIVRMLDAGATR